MSINILMPALSPTMTEGKLAKWHVKVGDAVKSGQVICEIETDKATMEVEAVDEGKIGQIVVPEGAEGVKVNAVIAILLEEGETAVPAGAAPRRCAAKAARPLRHRRRPSRPLRLLRHRPHSAGTCRASARREAGGGAERRPHLRLAARQAHRRGEGHRSSRAQGHRPERPHRQGRRRDRQAGRGARRRSRRSAAPQGRAPSGGQPIFTAPGDQRIPHTAMRKVIARRMLEVQADRAALLPDDGLRDRRAAGGARGDQRGGAKKGTQASRSTTW